MLNKLSWEGTNSLVGYLVKVTAKGSGYINNYWYKVVTEEDKEGNVKGHNGFNQDEAIMRYEDRDKKQTKWDLGTWSSVVNCDIVPIRKIF